MTGGEAAFDRALVAIDVSGAAEALVAALPSLRRFGTEEIALIHVAKPIEPVSRTVEVVEDVRERIEEIAAGLEEHGFEVTVEVPTGAPAAEIEAMADAWDPSFIVVGSRSRVRLAEAFVGSVAWDVVRRARRPILMLPIGPGKDAAAGDPASSPLPALPERIVYPTDFSDIARRALPWVEELVRRGVGTVTLLHALWGDDGDARDDALRRLEEIADLLRDAGASEVRSELDDRRAADAILASSGPDPRAAVVMGTHGRGFVPEIVLGSESRKVVREARVPLLLIPAPETEDL